MILSLAIERILCSLLFCYSLSSCAVSAFLLPLSNSPSLLSSSSLSSTSSGWRYRQTMFGNERYTEIYTQTEGGGEKRKKLDPRSRHAPWRLNSSVEEIETETDLDSGKEGEGEGKEEEEDGRVVTLSSAALQHLEELKQKQGKEELCLRMGVRSGGCSGMSYVMDICPSEEITEEDHIEDYDDIGIKAVIDPKSLLYLFGLQLDYKDALIGGGFQFYNPNADETCGCGKSFGV